MAVDAFIREEIRAIDEFRKAESRRHGWTLTRNEAALLWVRKGHAARFRKSHAREHINDRSL
jgi:hypothetical protein